MDNEEHEKAIGHISKALGHLLSVVEDQQIILDVLANRIKYLEICNEEHTDKLVRQETMILRQGMPLE